MDVLGNYEELPVKKSIATFCLLWLTASAAWADIPLIEAARDGDLEQLKGHLSAGVPVDSRGDDGYTALMWAARNGHMPVVRYLIKHDADPRATNSRGSSAEELANMFGQYETAKFIRQASRATSRRSARSPAPVTEPVPARPEGSFGGLPFDLPVCEQEIDVLKVARNTYYRRRWERIELMGERTVRATLHRKRRNYETEFRFSEGFKSGTIVFTGDYPGPHRWLNGLYKAFLKEYRRACYRY